MMLNPELELPVVPPPEELVLDVLPEELPELLVTPELDPDELEPVTPELEPPVVPPLDDVLLPDELELPLEGAARAGARRSAA